MAPRTFLSHPLVVRRVTVRRVEDITPRMRRIVLGGEALGEVVAEGQRHPAFAAPGFDDHVKLVFATDGDIEQALPRQLARGIEWTPAENRITRDYTPRWVDASAGEFALDFVLHGHGAAASWARSAAPGDPLAFVGPKSSVRLPEDLAWIALLADETGLPAVGRFLDERPVDVPAHLMLFIEDDEARQDLSLRPGDTISWHRSAPGDAAAIDDAVRSWVLPETPDGYFWAAAESRALLPVRRYLLRERAMSKERLNITGYWHRDLTQDGEDATHGAVPPVPEMPSPVPWLVVRAAVQLGVIDALADGPVPESGLEGQLELAEGALRPLLPFLLAQEVIVDDVGSLRLGRAGEALLDEHRREQFDGLEADAVLTLAHLADAVRTQRPAWEHAHGQTLSAQAEAGAPYRDEIVESTGRLAYLAGSVVLDPLWQSVSRAQVWGPGAAAIVGALDDAGRSEISLSIGERGAMLDALRADLGDRERLSWGADQADIAVLALALAHRTDAEAVSVLSEVGRHTERALVIESSTPDGLARESDAQQLLTYAMTGVPFRSAEALAALAEAAGWRIERTTPLGWGVDMTSLVRSV